MLAHCQSSAWHTPSTSARFRKRRSKSALRSAAAFTRSRSPGPGRAPQPGGPSARGHRECSFGSLDAMIRSDAAGLEERAVRMRELLASDRADEVTWFGLGQTLLALGRAAEAVEPLREAVRLRPDYTAAHRDLGRALLETGRGGPR